jgi:dynactin complex subunit
MERFSFEKLCEVESKQKYSVKSQTNLQLCENLDNNVDINRASETVREDIETSVKESLKVLKTEAP